MIRRSFLLTALAALLAVPMAGYAQDLATVPGWTPALGQKHTWKIVEVKEKARSGYTPRFDDRRAELTQHMTVLGTTLSGYSVGWDFDPPDQSFEANRFQQAIMEIYGVEKLSIGVDRGGMPLIAYGAEARDQRVESYAASLPPDLEQERNLLTGFRYHASEDPIFEVQLFVRPAMLIGRLQRAEAWTARKGETFRLQQNDHIYDARITGEAEFKVEDIDIAARRITISWVWDIPLDRLPIAMRRHITELMSQTAGQAAVLPLPLRGDAGSASFTYRGKAQISLEDGSLLSAEEERSQRIGFGTDFLTTTITRQP